MPLFTCDGCSEEIPDHKARLHCEVCVDYDTCANCYVIGRYTKSHIGTHNVSLKEKSGSFSPPPPALPPRPESISMRLVAPQSAVPVGTNGSWTDLFKGSQPTPLFVEFLHLIFARIDTHRTGFLAPEQYSAFCDVQGYQLHEDVWKRNIKPQFGYNPEDIADYELRTAFENFNIDHVLQPRIIAPNNDMAGLTASMAGLSSFAQSLAKGLQPKPISDGKMPMLSPRGFVDITVIEIVGEPNRGTLMLNRVWKHYGVWKERGEIPRTSLPEEPPRDLLERIKRVGEFSRRQAAERIEAARVEAMFKAQGRENALRLLDPPGTTYSTVYRPAY